MTRVKVARPIPPPSGGDGRPALSARLTRPSRSPRGREGVRMQLRALGRSGLRRAVAFGGNVFGWTADEATSFACSTPLSSGFNLVDTADVYSRWANGHTGGE